MPVSIRRADLGLLEPIVLSVAWYVMRFNPPGGFGAFGTDWYPEFELVNEGFQSAGRIWGFWNFL